ncbi:MAG: MFS transporter, partial [Liquorilactobacillus ghanensis]
IALIIGLNTGVQGLSALENVMLPELFGSIHRMTLVSLSKEIAGLISVGFGPVIAAAFVTKANGSWWPIALMIIFFSLVTFISAKCSTNTNQRNLNDLDDPM